MRVYYRGPDAVVTSEILLWRGTPPRSFRVRDLRNVGIARRDVDRPGRYLLATLLLAGMAVAAALTTPWVLLPAPLLGLLIVRRRAVVWELRADYEGRQVALYSSADSRVFHQVSRALRRAVEGQGPGAWHDAA